jgi:site-specific recombinase XerD
MPRKARQRKHRGVFERDKGSNIWWCRFVDVDGSRKARCVGTFSDAVNFYEEQKVRIRKRIVAPIPSHRGIRYAQLVDDALEYSKSEHRDQRSFGQRIEVTREQFGHRMAESITPADICEWLADMIDERDWSPATYNRYKAAMSKAYKLGIQHRKVTQNPARDVPQKPESAGRVRFLSDSEETRLRKALKHRPWAVPQLDVALHTGMRKGEQFSFTWNQVDFGQKFIHLTKTKNGSSRYVRLNSEALRVMRGLKANHEKLGLKADATLFLSHQHKPITDPREWFTTACEEAKIDGVTWHTLRHTFASRLVMEGVDLRTVQEAMGHKTAAMTNRYAHLSPQHSSNALERLVTRSPVLDGDHERT